MLIYKITNKINGKIYIGLTKAKTPRRRWIYHRRDRSRDTHLPLYKAMNKYGVDSFNFEVIHDNINSVEELVELEKFYIKKFESYKSSKGYNCTNGGECNDTLVKNKNANFGRKSKHFIELNRRRKGIPLSAEHRENISKSQIGRLHTNDSKNKMSLRKREDWANGVYSTKEYREKQSKSKIGVPNLKKRKIVICTSINRLFQSVEDAALYFTGDKKKVANIISTLKCRTKTAYGHRFEYYIS